MYIYIKYLEKESTDQRKGSDKLYNIYIFVKLI